MEKMAGMPSAGFPGVFGRRLWKNDALFCVQNIISYCAPADNKQDAFCLTKLVFSGSESPVESWNHARQAFPSGFDFSL
jgi:hypothetical protein